MVFWFTFVSNGLTLQAAFGQNVRRRDWKRNFPSHNAIVPPLTLSLSNSLWRFVTTSRERWKYPIHRASNLGNSEHLNIPHCILAIHSFFCKMAKKTDKKKGRSAINEVVTREYTINVHKRIHGMWVVSFVKLKKKIRKQCNEFITCIFNCRFLGEVSLFSLNPSILLKTYFD